MNRAVKTVITLTMEEAAEIEAAVERRDGPSALRILRDVILKLVDRMGKAGMVKDDESGRR